MAKQLTKKPINRKQKKFIKKMIEADGNVAKATDLAGYEHGYGYHLMKQPKIQTELQQALERADLTDDTLADGIKEGQEATYVKKDKGKAYPDYHARHKYYDMQIKIGGGYAPEKHEIKQEKLVVILSPELRKGLIDAEAMTEKEIEVIEAEVIKEDNESR
jgi:hypothetical protein